MAVMLDYAVNYKNQDIDLFFRQFMLSGFARQFGDGNPMVITGKTGVELYYMVNPSYPYYPEYNSTYRSPEFWMGWSLAYYQWYTARTFDEIIEVVQPSTIRSWYPTLHESDLSRFVEHMDSYMKQRDSNLKIIREKAGISQAQLSFMSGVSLSTIKMLEQRQNDISKAQINILSALARALNCKVYDLLDSNTAIEPNRVAYSTDQFIQQLMDDMDRNNREIARLKAEQAQRAAMINSYRYGYIGQFPIQAIQPQHNQLMINNGAFLNNWDNYWQGILCQQQQEAQKQRAKAVGKIAKEAIGLGLKLSGNKPASIAYDAMSAITADNIFEALIKVGSIVDTALSIANDDSNEKS
jgi:transcriptional regulator with XRE-family HTH domain